MKKIILASLLLTTSLGYSLTDKELDADTMVNVIFECGSLKDAKGNQSKSAPNLSIVELKKSGVRPHVRIQYMNNVSYEKLEIKRVTTFGSDQGSPNYELRIKRAQLDQALLVGLNTKNPMETICKKPVSDKNSKF